MYTLFFILDSYLSILFGELLIYTSCIKILEKRDHRPKYIYF